MDYLKELKFAQSSNKLNVLIEKMQRMATDQCCVSKINYVTNWNAKMIDKKSLCFSEAKNTRSQVTHPMLYIDDMFVCQSFVFKVRISKQIFTTLQMFRFHTLLSHCAVPY